MASPSNSQQSSTGPVCLSLLKFSYATVPMDSVAPVPWTHISSKRDLFAMFETARTRNLDGSVEERKKFKVLRDPEVMVIFLFKDISHIAISHSIGRARSRSPCPRGFGGHSTVEGCSSAQSGSKRGHHCQGSSHCNEVPDDGRTGDELQTTCLLHSLLCRSDDSRSDSRAMRATTML